jgi:hypothetical protein
MTQHRQHILKPEREKEIRGWLEEHGPNDYEVVRELLAEIDGLRESLRRVLYFMDGYVLGEGLTHEEWLELTRIIENERTEDHRNPTEKPRGIRGRK